MSLDRHLEPLTHTSFSTPCTVSTKRSRSFCSSTVCCITKTDAARLFHSLRETTYGTTPGQGIEPVSCTKSSHCRESIRFAQQSGGSSVDRRRHIGRNARPPVEHGINHHEHDRAPRCSLHRGHDLRRLRRQHRTRLRNPFRQSSAPTARTSATASVPRNGVVSRPSNADNISPPKPDCLAA